MQASSPLAALQIQPLHHWNLNIDSVSTTRSGPCVPSFDFKTLSMQTSRPRQAPKDYFTMKAVHRGSSPTANLAVDLSQNFHIDQSPLPPTPRRSLLDIFSKEPVSTPPLPASSPCDVDMEITPLHHKLPAFTTLITSPTPEPSPLEDETTMMLDSPLQMQRDMAAIPPSPLNDLRVPDIKKNKPRPARLRPDMKKAYSHCGVQMRTAPLEKPAPFLFGTHLTGSGYKPSLPMTLDECFAPSPEKENISFGITSAEATPVAAPRPRSANQNRHFGSPMNGSPIGPLQRRPGAIKRPRTSYRRSNSMYEHPDKWMSDKKTEMCMEAIAEQSTQPELALPHFYKADESIPRISEETFIGVLDGKYSSQFDVRHIVDCRFEYEFDGGHIDGAENCIDREGFAGSLLAKDGPSSQRTLIVFHCEFSEKRAPTTAMHFRAKDREVNAERYPHLSYPEIYILEGGYSSFFKQHRNRCYPQEHIAMEDPKHVVACERGLGMMKRPQKLSRAATFAFGEREHEHSLMESPTAQPRTHSVRLTCMGMDVSPNPPSAPVSNLGGFNSRRAFTNMRTVSH